MIIVLQVELREAADVSRENLRHLRAEHEKALMEKDEKVWCTVFVYQALGCLLWLQLKSTNDILFPNEESPHVTCFASPASQRFSEVQIQSNCRLCVKQVLK